MIEIVEGVGVGAGKSYYVAGRILAHLAAGGTAYASDTFGLKWNEAKTLVAERFGVEVTQDQYHVFAQVDIPRLHEVTPCGTDDCPVLVVVDEAHVELNARDWNDRTKRPFFNWLTQSRHQNTDVIFISQAAVNMDKQIARLATRVIRMRNLVGWQIPGVGKWPLKQFVVGTYDRDGKTLQNRKLVWHDRGIFGVYDSKVMRSAHKRAEGIVPRKLLKRSTKRNPMYPKILLIILVTAAIYFYKTWHKNPLVKWAGFTQQSEQRKPTPTPPVPPAHPSVSVAQARAAYELVVEPMRAAIGNDMLRTESGTYETGKMSRHGFVVGIQDGVVRVRKPAGETLFIVTDEMAGARPLSSGASQGTNAALPGFGPLVEKQPATPQSVEATSTAQTATRKAGGIDPQKWRTTRAYNRHQ